MKTVLILAAALGFLVLAITLCLHEWRELGGFDLSPAGYTALAMGVVVASVLGGGLMALIFFSSRSGLDDEVSAAAETVERHDDARR